MPESWGRRQYVNTNDAHTSQHVIACMCIPRVKSSLKDSKTPPWLHLLISVSLLSCSPHICLSICAGHEAGTTHALQVVQIGSSIGLLGSNPHEQCRSIASSTLRKGQDRRGRDHHAHSFKVACPRLWNFSLNTKEHGPGK